MDTVRCRGCTCTRSCTVALRPPPNKYGCTKYFRTSVLPCVSKLSTKVLPCLALWKYVYGNRYFRTKVLSYESNFVLSKVLRCTSVLRLYFRTFVQGTYVYKLYVYMYLHTPRRKNIDIMCIPVDSWTKVYPRSPNNSPRRTASQPSVSGIRLTHTRC
jgi:hypothetical protein